MTRAVNLIARWRSRAFVHRPQPRGGVGSSLHRTRRPLRVGRRQLRSTAHRQRRAELRPPPIAHRMALSVSSCLAIRERLAPIARRTAISRWRAVPRASTRVATLAQTMSSTTPTASANIVSAARLAAIANSLMGSTSKRTFREEVVAIADRAVSAAAPRQSRRLSVAAPAERRRTAERSQSPSGHDRTREPAVTGAQ
jgi:hypothetical protein